VRALLRRPVPLIIAGLGLAEAVRLVVEPRPLDIPVVVLLVLLAGAWLAQRRSDPGGGDVRASEAESFARILRGLARSVSPDAIVGAIVEELGSGTGASHVAVVRRRPEAGLLEAVVTATRPGTSQSRTTFPLSALEDPVGTVARARHIIASASGRPVEAVPVDGDPAGDPQLLTLGLVPERPATWPSQASPAGERSGQRIADGLAGRLRDAYGLRNLIAAPLRVNGRVEGAIILARRMDDPWPESARRILEAATIETSSALTRLYTLRDAETRATLDALTGLPNRRYFDEYVALLSRRRRAEDRVGVLMIDLDHFKLLNDTYGHTTGDHVLQAVARAIATTVRDHDVPARFGGEEFAVLLKNPSPEIAVEVGERIRRAIGALDLQSLGVPPVSVSIGVAVAETPDRPLGAVLEEADQALYRAKRAGRDRVVAA
jgi:diguanylate cyclase (GGDEF)-like protein